MIGCCVRIGEGDRFAEVVVEVWNRLVVVRMRCIAVASRGIGWWWLDGGMMLVVVVVVVVPRTLDWGCRGVFVQQVQARTAVGVRSSCVSRRSDRGRVAAL